MVWLDLAGASWGVTEVRTDVQVAEVIDEIEAAESGPHVAAFFDFDGTLIYGYSGLLAARRRAAKREISPLEAAQTLTKAVEMGIGRGTYADLLGVQARAWRGRSDDDLLEWGEHLFRSDLAARVYPDARRLIAAHRRKRHRIVIATSATKYQVAALAPRPGHRRRALHEPGSRR